MPLGQGEPLFAAVWPPEVRATLSWAHVVFAHAQQRVLVWNDAGELVCHVGIHSRPAKWADSAVRIGGIGGVITRQDLRNKGYASAAMRVAVAHMKEQDDADFGLLFCEPHSFAFYRGLGGAGSPARYLPNSRDAASASTSWRHSCSIWVFRRATARSIFAGFPGKANSGLVSAASFSAASAVR